MTEHTETEVAAKTNDTAATEAGPSQTEEISPRNIPWIAISVVITLCVLSGFYWYQTRLPDVVRIAGGPDQGRYDYLAHAIAAELKTRLNVEVVVQQTHGSLENLQLLESGSVDIGLYQPETRVILEGRSPDDSGEEPALFISNLYAEYLIPIVRADDVVSRLETFSGTVWSCNDRRSGDFAMTSLLLQHLGQPDASVNVQSVPYKDLSDRLSNGEVDIAVICCGLGAPILDQLLGNEIARPLQVPHVDAFVQKHAVLRKEMIPAGYFRTTVPPIPRNDFHTVSLRAQLLAHRKAPVRLIEEVTKILTDPRFQRRHNLAGLFSGGNEYATDRPEYTMHKGASHIFYPEIKPLINPDFVEGTEGIRSFVVSIIAACWLMQRWWHRRQMFSQEHRLDRYIRDLLQLERNQIGIDGEDKDDGRKLQNMLDEVTTLRQEALSEFTAHEINEDRAVDCFIEMCHALSDKINAKLTRFCITHR